MRAPVTTTRACCDRRTAAGLTLVELLVVVAVVAVVLMLAAPSFRGMIETQRLRGINAQFVTDVQFIRSEAVSRQEFTGISFGSNSSRSCYIMHTCGNTIPTVSAPCLCDCTLATARCTSPAREIRTVDLPQSDGVSLFSVPVGTATDAANSVVFDPATGGVISFFPSSIFSGPSASASPLWAETALIGVGTVPSLRTEIGALGRPRVCSPNGRVTGVDPC